MVRAVSGARSRISLGMDEGLLTDQRALLMKSSFPSCPFSPSSEKDPIHSRSIGVSAFRRFWSPWPFDAGGFVRGRRRLLLRRVLSFSLKKS